MSPGFYERWVFPRLNDAVGRSATLRTLRRELLRSTTGSVLEIGFGSGANIPFYSTAVSSVTGLEPSLGMTARAPRTSRHADAAGARPHPATRVRVVRGVAEALPFASGSFDNVVSTLTLCSVSRPELALSEVRRVLRPSGVLFVLEHGLAPEPGVARWQQRLNGLHRVIACGCQLTRPMADLIASAGFQPDAMRSFYVRGAPRVLGWLTMGTARRADA